MCSQLGKFLHLGEIQSLVENEQERRRKTRLNQVRHLSRRNSMQVISAVRDERQRQLQLLTHKLEKTWRKGQQKQLQRLELQYNECLMHVGDSHKHAHGESSITTKTTRSAENWERAKKRGKQALAKLSQDRARLDQQSLIKRNNVKLVCENDKEKQTEDPFIGTSVIVAVDGVHSELWKENSSSIASEQTTQHVCSDLASKAAVAEETSRKDNCAKKLSERLEQSELEHKRFVEAYCQMELEKEYNQLILDLEKISEIENHKWDFDDFEKNKCQMTIKQEIMIEELFKRLSIPVNSRREFANEDTGKRFVGDSESTDDTPVHTVVVSSLSNQDKKDEPEPCQVSSSSDSDTQSCVVTKSNEETTSVAALLGTAIVQNYFLCTEETILASHPEECASTTAIDISSLPITDESSTKLPQSSSWSTTKVGSHDSNQLCTDDTVHESNATRCNLNETDEVIEVSIPSKIPAASVTVPTVGTIVDLKHDHVPVFKNVSVNRRAVSIRRWTLPSHDHNRSSRLPEESQVLLPKAPTNRTPECGNQRFQNGQQLGDSAETNVLAKAAGKLSTIQEVDTPKSSWTINEDDSSLQGTGILEEPDLTLVESSCSSFLTESSDRLSPISKLVITTETQSSLHLQNVEKPQSPFLSTNVTVKSTTSSSSQARTFFSDINGSRDVTNTPTISCTSTKSWNDCIACSSRSFPALSPPSGSSGSQDTPRTLAGTDVLKFSTASANALLRKRKINTTPHCPMCHSTTDCSWKERSTPTCMASPDHVSSDSLLSFLQHELSACTYSSSDAASSSSASPM